MAIDPKKDLEGNWLTESKTKSLTKEELLEIIEMNISSKNYDHRIVILDHYLPTGILNDIDVVRKLQQAQDGYVFTLSPFVEKNLTKLIFNNLMEDRYFNKNLTVPIKPEIFEEFILKSDLDKDTIEYAMQAAASLGDEAMAELLVKNPDALGLLAQGKVSDNILFMVVNNDEVFKKMKEASKNFNFEAYSDRQQYSDMVENLETINNKVSKMDGENYMYDPDRDRHSREQPYEVKVPEAQKKAVAKSQERKTSDIPELWMVGELSNIKQIIPECFIRLANGEITSEEFNKKLKGIASSVYDTCSSKETFDAIMKPLLEEGDRMLKQAISEREAHNYDKAPKDRAIDSAIGPYLT